MYRVAKVPGGGGGGGVLGLIFAGYVPLASSLLVTFGQIYNFRDPSLVTFYFYEMTHF